MAKSNTVRDSLSDEAMREGNSFWQNRKQVSSGSSTSIYLSRIHSLVLMLGAIILVLGGTLVYLVLRSQQPLSVPQIAVQEVQPAKPPVAEVTTVSVLVAKDPIQPGSEIVSDSLIVEKFDASAVPAGAFTPQDLSAVLGQFALIPIRARKPITPAELTTNRSNAMAFEIPEGFRAVSIFVDGRTGVEGFAKPGTYVDVLWFNNDSRRRQQVSTIVSRAKVLSVAGTTEQGTTQDAAVKAVNVGTTATLLVTKKQAQVIELARNMGTLSLSLVGGSEKNGLNEDDAITVNDLYSRKFDETKPMVDGVLLTYNPVTGAPEKLVLKDKNWVNQDNSPQAVSLEESQRRRRAVQRAQTRPLPPAPDPAPVTARTSRALVPRDITGQVTR